MADKEEFLLLGCDGIFEIKSNQELINIVRGKLKNKENLKDIIENLLDTLIAQDTTSGYGCDNMTSIIV